MFQRFVAILVLISTFYSSALFSVDKKELQLPHSPEIARLLWVDPESLKQEEIREALSKAFIKTYYPYRSHQLYPQIKKEEWLHDFKHYQYPITMLGTQIQDKIGRGALMDPDRLFKNYRSIHQMGILPDYWKQGIGKAMVHKLEKEYSGIPSLVLVSQKINEKADKLYLSLGFSKSDYQHPSYNPEIYLGYRKNF